MASNSNDNNNNNNPVGHMEETPMTYVSFSLPAPLTYTNGPFPAPVMPPIPPNWSPNLQIGPPPPPNWTSFSSTQGTVFVPPPTTTEGTTVFVSPSQLNWPPIPAPGAPPVFGPPPPPPSLTQILSQGILPFGPPPPPPSWPPISTTQERNNGSGYGGSQNDTTLRNKGKQEAQKRQEETWANWQQQLERFLKEYETGEIVTKRHPVMDILKKVLRCQAPNWWWKQPQRKTYILALLVSIRLVQCHPEAWGNVNDADSAFAALEELVRTCKLLVGSSKSTLPNNTLESLSEQLHKATRRKISTNDKDLFLPRCVLQFQQTTCNMIVRTGDCLVVLSPEEHYRQTMRPLAFDVVSAAFDFPKHYYSIERKFALPPYASSPALIPESIQRQLKKNNTSKRNRATTALWKELSTYPTGLPIEYGSSVFVRAHEAELDKLRVLIIGPEDTPYANGCFFFDVSIGNDYPNKPPKVQFLTTTMCAERPKFRQHTPVRFNPNLYANGKVCLSLLGTWSGPGWISNESTLLQVIVSLQSLVLGSPNPYFNEPGFQYSEGTPSGDSQSKQYNQDIRRKTLKVAMLAYLYNLQQSRNTMTEQESKKQKTIPSQLHYHDSMECFSEFREILQHHFLLKKESIRTQLQLWHKEDASLGDLCQEFWEKHAQIMETKKGQNICNNNTMVQDEDMMIVVNDENPVTNSMATPKNDNVIELLDEEEEDRKPAAKDDVSDKVVDLT